MSRHPLVAVLRLLGGLLLVLGSVPLATAAVASDTTTISAKALSDHGCDNSQWHFVITGLASADQAPASISVSWSGGASASVALSRVTGGTAHYSTTAHLDATVTGATATIASDWRGQFNLSSGPCGSSSGGGGGGSGGSSTVTAGTPTLVKSCADNAVLVTIPSTEHVSYTLNGQATTSGTHKVDANASGDYTVVVDAQAAATFTLSGETHWVLSGHLSCDTAGGGSTTTIHAKALTDYSCDSSEWHFVITGLDSDAEAPSHITVTWTGGVTANVALWKVTGGTAHYSTTEHLDLAVTGATADIDSSWGGQFNLSHGPCKTSGETGSVTAGTPTVMQSCADHAAYVTIPSTEGVTYKLNGVVAAAGSHKVDADSNGHFTAVVTAEASGSATLTGTTEWDLSGTLSCESGGSKTVTPGTPSVEQSCEHHAAIVTIPDTEHVIYKINGTVAGEGEHEVDADSTGHYTVMVTAVAEGDYTLTGTTEWNLSGTLSCETGGSKTATAGTPTVVASCEHGVVVTIPDTEHVSYTLNGTGVDAGEHTVTADSTGHYAVDVKATATGDYTLSGTSEWTFTGMLSCTAPGGGTTTVPTGTPTVVASCATNSATVTIPSTEHVVYKLNGSVVAAGTFAVAAVNGQYTVVVTAEAASASYVLSGTTSWNLSGTLSCSTSGGGTVTPPGGTGGTGTGTTTTPGTTTGTVTTPATGVLGAVHGQTPGTATGGSKPSSGVLGTKTGSSGGVLGGTLPHTGPVVALGTLVATGGGLVLLGLLLMTRRTPTFVRVLAPARGRHRASRRG